MKNITIEIPDGKKAEWQNGVLTLVDEKPKDVTERIKTFQDAREAIGEDHKLCRAWKAFSEENADDAPDVEAYLKLRIIVAALNEGWEPKFTKDEYRWCPWFYLYTQQEIDKMNAEDKHRVVFRSNFNASAYAGVSCADAGRDSSYTYADIGSRLALKTSKLAEYCGKQFLDIWSDFVFKSDDKAGEA